ncbi:DUF4251 domain-containing protein [Chitinophaga sp. 30R24]|uniref:DUF4251 domain-containing protein n=1 Tax=Chitinophaga sp. 30R24 TaxID=3248838 RepID=UPI003B8F755B
MKRFFVFRSIPFLLLGLTISVALFAQDTKAQKKAERTAQIKSLVESQHYIFIAQNAFPMNGRMRSITPDYDVIVTKDSVVSYLPFFGRAYTADYGITKSPLDYKTKSFTYNISPGKKDGWTVTIKPKDIKSVQSMTLLISSEGNTTVQVTSNDRSPISFSGYITERKVKEKKQ